MAKKRSRGTSRTKRTKPTKRRKTSLLQKYSSGDLHGTQTKRDDNNTAVAGVLTYDNVTTTTNVTSLLTVAQSDTDFGRSGNHIIHKNMQFRGRIICSPPATGVYAPDTLRTVLLYDKAPNGLFPAVSDIIESSSGGTPTNQSIDPFKFGTRERFLILKDWLHTMPGFSVTVAAGVATYTSQDPTFAMTKDLVLEFYKDFKFQLDTKYIGTGATVPNISSGAFFLVLLGNFGPGNGPWDLQYSCTIQYTDVKG